MYWEYIYISHEERSLWPANHRSQSVVGQQEAGIFCFPVCGNLCHPEWSLGEQTHFHTTWSLHPKFGMQAILLLPVERLIDWARLLCVDSGKTCCATSCYFNSRGPSSKLTKPSKVWAGLSLGDSAKYVVLQLATSPSWVLQ